MLGYAMEKGLLVAVGVIRTIVPVFRNQAGLVRDGAEPRLPCEHPCAEQKQHLGLKYNGQIPLMTNPGGPLLKE